MGDSRVSDDAFKLVKPLTLNGGYPQGSAYQKGFHYTGRSVFDENAKLKELFAEAEADAQHNCRGSHYEGEF